MAALLMSVEKITSITNRCTIYEKLFGSEIVSGQVLDNLYTALVKLYAAVLRVMALAYGLFNKNTATRATHALFNPDDVSNVLAECQRLEVQVEIEAQNCERQRKQDVDARLQNSICSLQKQLEVFQKPILRTDDRVFAFLDNVDQRERLEILKWISNVQYGSHHNTVKERRIKSTCEWLLEHKLYLEWQDTSSSTILWLYGTRRFSMFFTM
jgi:ankyrin repeat domain-containing protein 50